MSDAAAFYRAEEGSSTEKVFWSQYAEAGHPVPLSDQLKQLVELHKVAEQAMKGLIVRLWPKEAMPGSYFGLVRRLVNACPRFEVIKRFVYISGVRYSLPGGGASVNSFSGSSLPQCTLARARARRAPSIQTERLTTSIHGHASTSRRSRPK